LPRQDPRLVRGIDSAARREGCEGARRAGHLGGGDAEYWVREVGGEIEQDWLGRKVTSPEAARKALAAFREHSTESARLASEFDAYQADWERRYIAVGEEAYQAAAERQLEREQQALRDSDTFWIGLPATVSPQGRAIAQQACNEAREKWEKQNRRLSYEEWATRKRRKR
jgi:hypothetical protein